MLSNYVAPHGYTFFGIITKTCRHAHIPIIMTEPSLLKLRALPPLISRLMTDGHNS